MTVTKGYKPHVNSASVLNAAMELIKSVPYKVSTRWTFYQLVQLGHYSKADYSTVWLPLQARARKAFWNGWAPDTLTDDTRVFVPEPVGWDGVDEWLDAITAVEYKEDIWLSQKYYVEVWFEAAAMAPQFKYLAPGLPLLSFHGECSISPKWEAAKRIEERSRRYGLPAVICYFGDDDPKGHMIPLSAIEDVRSWCSVDIEFARGGLNAGDGVRYHLPEHPDRPGAYQWEAVGDTVARQLIRGTVGRYFDFEAMERGRERERETTTSVQQALSECVEKYRHGNK